MSEEYALINKAREYLEQGWLVDPDMTKGLILISELFHTLEKQTEEFDTYRSDSLTPILKLQGEISLSGEEALGILDQLVFEKRLTGEFNFEGQELDHE